MKGVCANMYINNMVPSCTLALFFCFCSTVLCFFFLLAIPSCGLTLFGLFSLSATILSLIVHKGVQRNHGAYQASEVNDEQLVVGVHYEASCGHRVGEIWEE